MFRASVVIDKQTFFTSAEGGAYMRQRHLLKYMLAFAAMSAASSISSQAQTAVHVLDVDQGLSILVESQGHYMLYDGGDRNKSRFVVAYLKQKGIVGLDYLIASHYDADHINGLVGVLNTTSVEQIFAPDYEADSRVYHSFQETIAAKKIPKEQPDVGTSYQLGDAVFQILSPSGSGYSDANDYSIGIRIVDQDESFLITGDAESTSETEICNTQLDLDSDVYVMGHHGSGTSSSWRLLEEATPEYAVLSCGAGNSYGHPHIESMEKLQSMGIELFRTDKQGTIIASTDGTSITWNREPCNDYTPGDSNDSPVVPAVSRTSDLVESSVSVSTEYILNTSTKKIHYPGCKSVAQMKEKNKKATNESRESLIAKGYSPCGNCKP